jgi:hypothetical protein
MPRFLRQLRITWLSLWLSFGVLAALRMPFQLGLRTKPDWVVAGLCVAISFVPWLPWPRQFSLRALLIATTFIAVALGLVVWSIG